MDELEIRLCDNCGHINDVSSLECEKCSFDLTFVVPTIYKNNAIASENNALNVWTFQAIDDKAVEFIVDKTISIGREYDILQEYFNKSDFISRNHSRIFIEDNTLFIEDLSTNGTFLNGIRIIKSQKTEINVGDIIAFADLKFLIK